jgi:hypothetical protein
LSTLHDLWIPPEFPECFDGDFLRAGRVANNTDDGAGYAFVMNVEEGFEIERAAGDVRVPASGIRCLTRGVHVI